MNPVGPKFTCPGGLCRMAAVFFGIPDFLTFWTPSEDTGVANRRSAEALMVFTHQLASL